MKKRIINIIFYLIMILCIGAIFYFNNDFKDIYLNSKNYYKFKDYKYVSIDLTKAKLNRLSYELNKKKYNVYTVKMKDFNILVYLNKNTALTKKVKVIRYKDDNYSSDIKTSLENDSDNNTLYYKGYYSNINYQKNKFILDLKKYMGFGLIGLIVILIIKEIIMLIKKFRFY